MTTKAKATKHNGHAKAEAKDPETQQAADWAKEMIDNLTKAQKRWIELASEQNALVLKTVTEGLNHYKDAPTPALAAWARQGIEGFIEAQKRWTDLVSQQSKQFFETMRADNFDVEDVRRTMSNYTGKGVELLVKARTKWLDFIAEQNAQMVKTVKDGLGLKENSPVTAVADFTQQAVHNYVEVQKRWLDLATQLPFMRPPEKRAAK